MSNDTNTPPPNGYKYSAVGIIPLEWEVMRLGETGKVVTGNTPSRTDLSLWNGDFCWATAKDFKEKYINDTVEKITEKGCNGARLLPKGAILITCIASIGNNAIAAVPLATNQQINSIVVSDDFNNEWLYYQLDFYKQNLELLASKTAVPLINKSEFEKLKLPIPPLPEQQKIAEILSTWDDAITNCKNTIITLKDRNKGLAQQLLTGKKRLSGFSEKWAVKKIKDFSLEISIKNKNDDALIVLSCTKHNGLVPSLEYFGRKIYSDNLKTYKIVEKDVFAYATNHIEEGSIGYQSKYEKALISPMYTVFKTEESINDEFLFRVLKSNTYIQEYQKRMEGSIDRRGGLRWQEFSKIKVNVPSYEEQSAIALVLETADQELKSYETKLEALQLQKKGLMQQLLTGKIRVNVN